MPDPFFAPERLETAEFVVRSYLPGDGARYVPAVNESYEHLHPFLAWAKPHTTPQEGEQVARRFRARYLQSEDFALAILNADESRWLGSSGFHLREYGLRNHSAEIGMWIRRSASGRGLGTRVLCALLDWGFDAWPWERLAWRCNARNLASRRTAEKAGMALEGRLRAITRQPDGSRDDILCFSALKGEWHNPLA